MSAFSIQEIESFIARNYNAQKFTIVPFGYSAQFSALAQNATQTQQINIAANGDFIMLGLRYAAWLTTAGQTVTSKSEPIARLLLIDSGSNEQFTQAPTQLRNFGSNDAKLVPFSYPRIIPGRSTITAQLTNNSPAAESQNVEIFLDGVYVRELS